MKKSKYLIYGRWVKVKKVKGLAQALNVWGRFFPTEFRIEIDAEMVGEFEHRTTYHEVVHALLERGGLAQSISPKIQEIICEQMAVLIQENFVPKK
jgi:hypothetical protein